MTKTCVTASCKDMISTVVIDNPPDNYLSRDVLAELNRTVSEVHAEQADLRVVLFMAKGRNFSAGIDYPALPRMKKDEAGHLADVGFNLLKHIEALPVPVIAALKGETTGAGLGLALAADIRIHQTVKRARVRRAAIQIDAEVADVPRDDRREARHASGISPGEAARNGELVTL